MCISYFPPPPLGSSTAPALGLSQPTARGHSRRRIWSLISIELILAHDTYRRLPGSCSGPPIPSLRIA